MIVLDTHIWIWWVHGDPKLPLSLGQLIQSQEASGLAVSAISCWEVAKLVEYQRLRLPCSLEAWFAQALAYPGVQLVALTPEIAITSTRLENFHRDPADQIIVATAKVLDCPLLTVDRKILDYPGVETPL